MIDLTKPVRTRDGRKAEVIGSLPDGVQADDNKPVAVAVYNRDGIASIEVYTTSGRFDPPQGNTCWDLVNVETISADSLAGGLELLRAAVLHGDPKRELLFRINDLIREASATPARKAA